MVEEPGLPQSIVENAAAVWGKQGPPGRQGRLHGG